MIIKGVFSLNKILFFSFFIIINLVTPVLASEQTVIATGTYLIGDGPNETISVAKDRAREEAMRMASEKAGVYVESYSKTNNSVLTKDEVHIIAGQVLKIQKEELVPQIMDNNYILWKCTITALVNTDQIDLKKIMADKVAVKRAIILEKKVQELQKENQQLKIAYNSTKNIEEKNTIEKRIINNEKTFEKSLLSTLGFKNGKWTYEVDTNNIIYDKVKQTITYSLIGYDNAGNIADKRNRKILINTNQYLRLGTTIFLKDGTTTQLRTGYSKEPEHICPDSEEEFIQKKLYKYLGVNSAKVNNPPQWIYITRWGDEQSNWDVYYDKNNMKIDRNTGTINLFI